MRSAYRFSEYGTETYFLTFTIVEWIQIFKESSYCDIIIDNLEFYRENQGLRIHYLVIMPDHIHVIVSSDKYIGEIVRNLKSYSAKEIIRNLKQAGDIEILHLLKLNKRKYKNESEYQVWQEGSHPELITTPEMLHQKINYIHFNPVKADLVQIPEQWIYSSAGYYDGKECIMEFDEMIV